MRRRERGAFARAAIVVALATGPVATATAQPSGTDRARATLLFNEGRDLMAAHRTTEACEKFDESQRLDPGGGTLMNLARCREEEGRIATAWSEFTEAAAGAARDGRQDREAEAKQHIRTLEPRLSKLTIAVAPDAAIAGLAITIDGSPVGRASWSNPFPVDGGDHAIEASAEGKTTYRATVHVESERDEKSITIPRLVDAPVIPSKKDSQHAGDGQLIVGATVSAAGVAELAVGAYFGARAISKHHESETDCPQRQCTSAGVAAEVDAGKSADAATALVTLGVVSAALGVTLMVTRPRSTHVAVTVGAGRASIAGTF